MSFQLPSPAFLGVHLMQKSLFQVLIQQKDCEHNGAQDTVISAGTQKHTMAKRKASLRCFLGWLKVLMKPLGHPGTSSAHRAHLLCLHRVTVSPPERSGCQHTKAPMSKQLSKTKAVPEKTAKAIHRLLGCLFQEQLRNGEEAAGQVTSARIQNPCIIRVGLWNILPSHTPSQSQHVAGGGKTSQETKLVVRNTQCHPRQLTVPQHKEDNKDDLSS